MGERGRRGKKVKGEKKREEGGRDEVEWERMVFAKIASVFSLPSERPFAWLRVMGLPSCYHFYFYPNG